MHVCHNILRGIRALNTFVELCCLLNLRRKVARTICTPEPALLICLVPSWSIGKQAACDITIVNLLNPNLVLGASSTVGHAAAEKEVVKRIKNYPKSVQGIWMGVHSPGCRDIWWLGREGN